MTFEVKVRMHEGIPVLSVNGDIDILTSDKFNNAIFHEINCGHSNLVIDLREVNFMDSSSLMVLIKAQREVRQKNGYVTLVDTTNPYRAIIRISGMDKTFSIYSTIEEAVSRIKIPV